MEKIEYISLKSIADSVSEWCLLAYYAHDEIQRQIYDDRLVQSLNIMVEQVDRMAKAKEEAGE
jgi:hypothetical protein